LEQVILVIKKGRWWWFGPVKYTHIHFNRNHTTDVHEKTVQQNVQVTTLSIKRNIRPKITT